MFPKIKTPAGGLAAVLALGLAAIGGAPGHGEPDTAGRVPLARTSLNHYGFHAAIDGHAAWLTLDTGAPRTLLDAHFCRRNLPADSAQKLPAGVSLVGGVNGLPGAVGWVQDLTAGSMHFGGGPVAIADLSMFPGGPSHDFRDRDIAGFIGVDILVRYHAVIDWTGRQVYFESAPGQRSRIGRAAASHGWTAVPMEFTSGRHLVVPCTFGQASYHLIVDTGSVFTLLDQGIWGKVDITRNKPHTLVVGLNMAMIITPVVLKNWSIGTFPMRNSAVGVGPLNGALFHESTPSSGRVVGLLGSEWLAFRSAIIDVGGMTLYLKQPGA